MIKIEFPALYRAADHAANKYQREFVLAFGSNVVCLASASWLSVINIETWWFAILIALVLALSLSISVFLGTNNPQKRWYAARALAESVKTISWRFMMRGEPYEDDDASARERFVIDLRRVYSENQQLSAIPNSDHYIDQITQEMDSIRHLALHERIEAYKNERVADQYKWYVAKALANQKRGRLAFAGLYICIGLSILLSLVRIKFHNVDNWPTDGFVALAAGLLSWLQMRRYQELSASYSLAAHEISLIAVEIKYINREERFSVFVGDAENAFSREHTQWRARRDQPS
jgi:hypothetical protein